MSNLKATVIANDAATGEKFATSLRRALGNEAAVEVGAVAQGGAPGRIVFVDGTQGADPEPALRSLDRGGRAIFLITEDRPDIPRLLEQKEVDDVLVFPFRPLEVLGKLRHYQQILMWDEVQRLNASFA